MMVGKGARGRLGCYRMGGGRRLSLMLLVGLYVGLRGGRYFIKWDDEWEMAGNYTMERGKHLVVKKHSNQ